MNLYDVPCSLEIQSMLVTCFSIKVNSNLRRVNERYSFFGYFMSL